MTTPAEKRVRELDEAILEAYKASCDVVIYLDKVAAMGGTLALSERGATALDMAHHMKRVLSKAVEHSNTAHGGRKGWSCAYCAPGKGDRLIQLASEFGIPVMPSLIGALARA